MTFEFALLVGATAAVYAGWRKSGINFGRVDVPVPVPEERPEIVGPEERESPSQVSAPEPVPIVSLAPIQSPVRAKLFGTRYDDLIYDSALANNIDPHLFNRLLYAESHFRADIIDGKVRSRAGALGIAQFMPATALDELGSVSAALDPDIAIPGAARYLAKLLASTGDIASAVAAYNWGIGNVKGKGLALAPSETRNYVKQITGVDLS